MIKGNCACGKVQFSLKKMPMIVHCCHCTWCQRETGSAFAINALVEATELEVEKGNVETITTPSNSGAGQEIVRCPHCEVALWSYYAAAKRKVAFLRVGTLEEPGHLPPDIHIYTSSKLPWFDLNDDAVKVLEYYKRSEVWTEENVQRYKKAIQD